MNKCEVLQAQGPDELVVQIIVGEKTEFELRMTVIDQNRINFSLTSLQNEQDFTFHYVAYSGEQVYGVGDRWTPREPVTVEAYLTSGKRGFIVTKNYALFGEKKVSLHSSSERLEGIIFSAQNEL